MADFLIFKLGFSHGCNLCGRAEASLLLCVNSKHTDKYLVICFSCFEKLRQLGVEFEDIEAGKQRRLKRYELEGED